MKTIIKHISTSKEMFYRALQEFSKEFQDYMKQHPEYMDKFVKAWHSGDDRVLLKFLREFTAEPSFSSITRSLQMKTVISLSGNEDDSEVQAAFKKFQDAVKKHISTNATCRIYPDPDDVVTVFEAKLGKGNHFYLEDLQDMSKQLGAVEESLGVSFDKGIATVEWEYD
jgi:hypothetical protein